MTINHARLAYEIVTRLPQLSNSIALPSVYSPQNYAVTVRFIEMTMAKYAVKTKQAANLNKSKQFNFDLATNQFKRRALPEAVKKHWVQLFSKPDALSTGLPAAANIIPPEQYLLFLSDYNEQASYKLDEVELELLDQAIIEAYREVARGGCIPCSSVFDLQPIQPSGESSSELLSSQASISPMSGAQQVANSVLPTASSSSSSTTAPQFFRFMPESGFPYPPITLCNVPQPSFNPYPHFLAPQLFPGCRPPVSVSNPAAFSSTSASSDANHTAGYAAAGIALLQKVNDKLVQALGQTGSYNELGFFNQGNPTQQAQAGAVLQQIKTNALKLAEEIDKTLSTSSVLGPRTFTQFDNQDSSGPASKYQRIGGPSSTS